MTARYPGFENHPLKHGTSGLSKKRRTTRTPYSSYRVQAVSHGIEREPSVFGEPRGQRKRRVTIAMKEPNTWGGMFLGEYTVTAQSG